MQKLWNGYAIYDAKKNTVSAMFRGELDIVFEGISKDECMKFSHANGMKMIDRDRYISLASPAFRKVNAKNPVDAKTIFIGTVY